MVAWKILQQIRHGRDSPDNVRLDLPPSSDSFRGHHFPPQPATGAPPAPNGSAGYVALSTVIVLSLLFLTFIGCAVINRFIFTPTKGITSTPAASSIPYQEVWFPSRDGVRLNGWFISGAPAKPLVLFFHGNTGNLSDNLEYIKLLHGRGFPIFIFDYRGYGKSEGEPVAENDIYQDARGAISYLEGRGWRHQWMLYFGQSLGGAVALQMALETPPSGLVMEGAFTCMKDIVKHMSPFGYYTVGWWGIDLPFDNLAKIAQVKVPVLLIHGEKDPVVPMDMTMRLYARAVQPKMLYIIMGGGHCNALTLDSAAYLAAWNNYLQTLTVRTASRRDVKP